MDIALTTGSIFRICVPDDHCLLNIDDTYIYLSHNFKQEQQITQKKIESHCC